MKKITIILSLCLMALMSSVKAQEATLQETLDFIGKMTVKSYGDFDENGNGKWIALKWLKIKDDQIDILTSYLTKSDMERKIVIDLNSPITISSDAENVIFISGLKFKIRNLGNVNSNWRIYDIEDSKLNNIYYGADTPRLLKAYKHLFELLNIEYTIDTPPVDKF